MKELQSKLETYIKCFHRHPELSNQEHKTTAKIREILDDAGIKIMDTGLKTGLVAFIPGKELSGGGPVTALRADIDALPIQEASGLDYASETPGVMHACGHDFHLTALLGASMLLKGSPPAGDVKLVFQPAEEGGDGAEQVLSTGALDDVKEIYGLHVDPSLENGVVAINSGAMYAGVGLFGIVISGKGGHAAMPQLCKDPVVAAAQLINSAQTIVSRSTGPLDNVVVSITHMDAGNTWNVIPPEARLEGTIRAMTTEGLSAAAGQLDRICKGIAIANDVEVAFTWRQVTAAVNNDRALSERTVKTAVKMGFTVVPARLTMGGEDFACYQQRIPGVFFNFGVGGAKPLHHPEFIANPTGLSGAASLLAALAREGGAAKLATR